MLLIVSPPNMGLGKETLTARQTGDLAIDNVSSHYIPCSRTACTVHRTQQLAQGTQYNHLHLDTLLPLHIANFYTSSKQHHFLYIKVGCKFFMFTFGTAVPEANIAI